MKKYKNILGSAVLAVLFSFMLINSANAAAFTFSKNLHYSLKNGDVVVLQKVLIHEGCLKTTATGYFGPATRNAVKCFQRKYNFTSIPSSGYVGSYTRKVLNNVLTKNPSILNQSIKDLSKYPAKAVFLVSDEDWHSILTLIPVAVWTTNDEVIKHPLVIYHKEGNSYDIDSPSHFFNQYGGNNIIYSGNPPEQIKTLFTKPFQLIGKNIAMLYTQKIIMSLP